MQISAKSSGTAAQMEAGSYTQLDTIEIDATAAAVTTDVGALLTLAGLTGYKEVSFVIANRGTASAYLATAADILAGVESALEIDPGVSKGIGPYLFPNIPLLDSLIGAHCFITTMWKNVE